MTRFLVAPRAHPIRTALPVLVFALLGAFAPTASAGPQSGTLVTVARTDVGPLDTNWSAPASVRRFDPGRGTLVSVEAVLTMGVDAVVWFENTSPSSAFVRLDVGTHVVARRPDGTVLIDLTTRIPQMAVLSAFDGSNDFAGPSATTWSTSFSDSVVSLLPLTPADRALLVGHEPLTIQLEATDATFLQSAPASYTSVATQRARAYLTLSYRYDPRRREFCFGDGGDANGCTPCPCGNDLPAPALGGCTHSGGDGARLTSSGTAAVTADTLVVGLERAPALGFAVLVSGANALPSAPGHPCTGTGNGVSSAALDGLRCIGGGLRRLGVRATNAAGAAVPAWGAGAGPPGGLAAAAQALPGSTFRVQAFLRDDPLLVCGSGSATSSALAITVAP